MAPASPRVFLLTLVFMGTLSTVAFAQAENPHFVPVPSINKGDDMAKVLGQGEFPGGEPVELSDDAMQVVAHVWTDPGSIPVLQIKDKDGKAYDLPLEHTHVSAEVSGFVARVEVMQTYQNPFSYPIETIYVFPLPENSAVDDMKIVIGERIIEAEIQRREQARETYEKAKAEGFTAALLEQERPNVFTQSVANIAPGEDIHIIIRYVQDLAYDSGQYEFVFPMVVGPRFTPGKATGKSGSGWAMDTDVVPDASRISPPIVGAGMRSGHDISLSVRVDAGLPVTSYSVPTHEVASEVRLDGTLDLAIAEQASLPNRDFVLRYSVAGKKAAATVLTHHDKASSANGAKQGGYLALIVQPPNLDIDKLVGNREIIFVVDVSGSMAGKPLAMCKDAMRLALRALRPTDTFNVISFAGASKKVFEKSRPANNTNLVEASAFIDAMRSGGGTQLADAIAAALAPQVDQRNRYVVFMTDGYVSNEAQILGQTELYVDEIKRQGQTGRVFGFGVGSSVNRNLLDGLGKQGNGLTFYATNREDPANAINRIMGLIDHPVMTDVSIDWGDLDVSDVYPQQLPDVFASHPFVVHARYNKGGADKVVIKGTLDGKSIKLPLEMTLPQDKASNSVLATLWARAAIDELERDLWFSDAGAWSAGDPKEKITELGLGYRIVTAYTSFVAVDRSRKVGDGSPTTIVQPVDGPEEVDLRSAAPSHALVQGTRSESKPAETRKVKKSKRPSPRPGRPAQRHSEASSADPGGAGGVMAPMISEEAELDDAPAPAPRSQPAIALGGLSSAVVEQQFRDAQSAINACLDKDKGKGEVAVRLSITTDGKVESVEFTGKLDAKAKTCAEKAIKKFVFPAAETPTTAKKVLRVGKGAWNLPSDDAPDVDTLATAGEAVLPRRRG